MAYIPEYGTLGYNRGRAMNEPLSREQYERNAYADSTTRSILIGDDPILKMQESQMTAGAVGTVIGMLILIGLVIWNFI